MSDSIKWKILEDGTVSIETDQISGENHLSADELLESLADMLGGPMKIEERKGHVHKHRHTHNEQQRRH
ncbi:MAG: hypothetical protein V2A73_13095 [Pseudomonadota bacterium]